MIANSITTLRIILVIIMSFFLSLNDEFLTLKANDDKPTIILIIFQIFFIIAIITDFLDGYFAKKFKQKTNFGKFFDPIADKLLVINSLFFLYKIYDVDKNNRNELILKLPQFFFNFINVNNIRIKSILIMVIMVIIIRDFLVTGIRLLASEKNYIIEASLLGKIKTAFTFIIIGFLLFESIYLKNDYDLKAPTIIILLLIIVILNLISGINYLIKNFYIIKNNF